MYRQVLVHESQRDLQLILWRDDESQPLRTLRLNTVTYGFASASFLSTRCIWQIGEECQDPLAKTIIQKDFYVDDLLTGHDDEEQLRFIQKSVSQSLAAGCFPLRKYRSNLPSILAAEVNNTEGNLMLSSSTDTLGLNWDPSVDILRFSIEMNPVETLTKRSILSSTFKIFDPLGLVSPCTIIPKLIIQSLWSLGLNWDDPAPQDIQTTWQKFADNIKSISELSIPRRVLIDNYVTVEMHVFCDASQKAYGSAVYLRSLDAEGRVLVRLLCAKSRVAPIKPVSIPRLELCGALLAAQLSVSVTGALRCQISRHVYWTDSSVVLSWLNTSSNKLKTFVANRVSEIGELTDVTAWRHVPTLENPADLLSRGVEPNRIASCSAWWQGPTFLQGSEESWPSLNSTPKQDPQELPELKVNTVTITEPFIPFSNFSKLRRLQRAFAFVYRFINNCRDPNNKLSGPLQVSELNKSFDALVKFSQNESFGNDIKLLENKQTLNRRSNILSLDPFLDTQGILRVGGRLAGASVYTFDKRHPIILHANHHFTKLLFQQEHQLLFHAPPQLLLGAIKDRIWPIGGRNLARRTYHICFICRRFRGKTLTNKMGNLPAERVTPDYPFYTTGTDFAGPFLITDRKGRGCRITKAYLCIFICFRYKCIHLEAVSQLSKDAFTLCLQRFISRRGKPKQIFCDNGRNFVATAREINEFLKLNTDGIVDFAADKGIEFRFSPAYAPNFGGLWEAGVKSAKFHLNRVLGNAHLTFEELSSLFSQIEAILNSRPLCPLSSSPQDFAPLTPGHFLIGRPLTALPSPCLLDSNTNRLDRFQRLEQIRQHFWKRWSSEYVPELQQRTKWKLRCRDLKPDDLVLLKEDLTPPLNWRLGRINLPRH
ncbi:uncharacterized protein LOC125227062 [Leguminivora glycinivorella]|uniref:uncharacterized protein LOC125227062 n=1 Tax=Leguminivora glycinivorella TaxID=1035111 RepID=UPI00200E4597|nr:uncharacterized protein LOC125227062 [Leguminivora glycinivorella]